MRGYLTHQPLPQKPYSLTHFFSHFICLTTHKANTDGQIKSKKQILYTNPPTFQAHKKCYEIYVLSIFYKLAISYKYTH